MAEKSPKRRGPPPDRLKIEDDWEEAIKKALRKERPKDGWPKPPKPGKSGPKSHSEPEPEDE